MLVIRLNFLREPKKKPKTFVFELLIAQFPTGRIFPNGFSFSNCIYNKHGPSSDDHFRALTNTRTHGVNWTDFFSLKRSNFAILYWQLGLATFMFLFLYYSILFESFVNVQRDFIWTIGVKRGAHAQRKCSYGWIQKWSHILLVRLSCWLISSCVLFFFISVISLAFLFFCRTAGNQFENVIQCRAKKWDRKHSYGRLLSFVCLFVCWFVLFCLFGRY